MRKAGGKHRAPNYRRRDRADGALRECRKCEFCVKYPCGPLSDMRMCYHLFHVERVSETYVCDDYSLRKPRHAGFRARLRRTFDWIFARRAGAPPPLQK